MGKIHYIKSMSNLSVINQIHFYKEARERGMYRWSGETVTLLSKG